MRRRILQIELSRRRLSFRGIMMSVFDPVAEISRNHFSSELHCKVYQVFEYGWRES